MAHCFEKLENRAMLEISGEDVETFLDNLITCNVVGLDDGEARFGALLTPQGKILFDFFIIRSNEGYLIDINRDLLDDFRKRLMFYRLRAKVDINLMPEMEVSWYEGPPPEGAIYFLPDPRNSNLHSRAYGKFTQGSEGAQYHMLRIVCGVPEGGFDFQYGDAYPHETLMDQYGGVDFKKGCYVGQEVVSRMQHRGTAKKRIVHIQSDIELPESGTPILADDKPAGTLGTTEGTKGLALLRLDRVAKAEKLTAEGVECKAMLPDWVSFGWPELT